MLKKIINHIFIYISLMICIGCEGNMTGINESCSDCVLELNIPELSKDKNNFYHLEFDEEHIQTFAQLEAYVGIGYAYIGWYSDTEHCIEMWDYIVCSDVVNPASYSGSDGYSHQILGVYPEHIGDTIIVQCGYYDDYGVQYLNTLEIIVDE